MFNSWVNDKRKKALVLIGKIIVLLILSYSHYSPFTLLLCSKFWLRRSKCERVLRANSRTVFLDSVMIYNSGQLIISGRAPEISVGGGE